MSQRRMREAIVAGLLVLICGLPISAQESTEAQALAREAQDLAGSMKLEEAIALMKKASALAPKNDLYLAMTADFEMKAGKFADGMEHALQAVKLNDKVGAYHVLVAANAMGAQDLDRAREYCALILKRGPAEMGAGACRDATTIQKQVVEKTYTLHWKLDPTNGRAVRGTYVIALPKSNIPNQTVSYEINGVRSHRLVKGAVNDFLYVVPNGTETFPLTTRVTVRPHSFKKELEKAAPGAIPADARSYLGASELINPRSPAVMKVAAQLRGKDPAETVRNILAWMKKNIEYKLKQTSITELDFKSMEEILERGHAECRGYTMLFAALCRAAEVPTRTVWGLTRVAPGQDQRFGDIASHNWAEVYIAGAGWIPVDPQKPQTFGLLPTSCIRIMVDPAQSRGPLDLMPLMNVVYMNREKLMFDETWATSPGSKP